jgi:hypothetical protein
MGYIGHVPNKPGLMRYNDVIGNLYYGLRSISGIQRE